MKPRRSANRRADQFDGVLRFRPVRISRAKVRRHYALWREQQSMATRCDMEHCVYHSEPLIWAGKRLPLILDHVNGNSFDNNPKNLRYLCPNCDSQLSTRGGANRGRVAEIGDGKYVLLDRDGRRHYHFIPEAGHFRLTGYPASLSVQRSDA